MIGGMLVGALDEDQLADLVESSVRMHPVDVTQITMEFKEQALDSIR